MGIFSKKEEILSNTKYSDYLPVGTIIKLNNDDNDYIIFRYLGNRCMSVSQKNKVLEKSNIYSLEKPIKNYKVDYAIHQYPYGSCYSSCFFIRHEDIKEIVYLGYDDEYRKNILNDIDAWSNE